MNRRLACLFTPTMDLAEHWRGIRLAHRHAGDHKRALAAARVEGMFRQSPCYHYEKSREVRVLKEGVRP